LSDLTEAEFMAYFAPPRAPQNCSATKGNFIPKLQSNEFPEYWDWRDVNAVTPVKNQGGCGSCWTFSTVGSIEGQFFLKYGYFKSFAEQQLVDCANAFGNNGCRGGLPSSAFEYLKHAGGLNEEKDYAYEADDSSGCRYKPEAKSVEVPQGSVNITAGDEEELKWAIFEAGPVAVCYQVVSDFRDYKSGVYTSSVCKNGQQDVNHAVTAVGFGVDE